MPDLLHRPVTNSGLATSAADAHQGWRRFGEDPRLLQVAVFATLLLPLPLFYARAIGDFLITLVAVLFLARACMLRDWRWLDSTHARLALVFWLWQVFCTLVSGNHRAIGEALAVCRLFLFGLALESWVLLDQRRRRQLWFVVLIAALWVVIETFQQYLLGTNIFGNPRWGSGVLSGPFLRPRAGATLQVLFLPAFLPPIFALLMRPGIASRIAAALLLAVTVLTEVLIAQRMPMLLLAFSLCLTALVVRRFRWPIVIAIAAAVVMVAVSRITYATLVLEFLHRMDDFWATPYAELYQRCIAIVQAHPWMGLGFDGFRDHCNELRYIHEIPWLPVTDFNSPNACTIHPHNYWLQVATSTGLPGVLLFAALCVAWLRTIGRGVSAGVAPVQVALFVTLCTIVWPIASTTALFTVPNAGWIFLIVGWGLAEQNRQGDGMSSARDLDLSRRTGFTVPIEEC